MGMKFKEGDLVVVTMNIRRSADAFTVGMGDWGEVLYVGNTTYGTEWARVNFCGYSRPASAKMDYGGVLIFTKYLRPVAFRMAVWI